MAELNQSQTRFRCRLFTRAFRPCPRLRAMAFLDQTETLCARPELIATVCSLSHNNVCRRKVASVCQILLAVTAFVLRIGLKRSAGRPLRTSRGIRPEPSAVDARKWYWCTQESNFLLLQKRPPINRSPQMHNQAMAVLASCSSISGC